MSTITWLHLSDLHFRAEEQDTWDQSLVLKALLEDIKERIEEDNLHPDFIVVTGDIAFSGKPAEYDLARHFFDELLRTTGLAKDRLFLVPGNHDIDRSLITRGAQAICDSLKDRRGTNAVLTTPADRRLVFAGFGGYSAFVNDYFGEHLPFDDDHYFYVRLLDLAGQRVAVLGLDSAWASASDEDEAKRLLLGERQARAALDKAKDEQATLKIALLHHPFGRLREFDQNDSAALLLDNCDFTLHGHLHRSGILSLRGPDAEAMVIAAGACYESRGFPNTYNWVRLDLLEGIGTVILRRYSDKRGGFWSADTLTYRNVPDGKYTFPFPPAPPSRPVGEPPVPPSPGGRPDEPDEGGPPGKPGKEPPEKPGEGKPSDQSGEPGKRSPGPPDERSPEKPVPRRAVLLLVLALLAGAIIAVLCCLLRVRPIAFSSGTGDSQEIYVMNSLGWFQTPLTENGALNESPAWSPDGERLAFHSDRDGDFEVYVMNADGSGEENLTNNPDANDGSPSWSPDGKRIAFDRDVDWNCDIYLINADGTGVTRLTDDPARDSLPAWSPDGKIAFTSRRDGNAEIYVMNADGTGQTRLTNRREDDESPAWSPDGKRIAFHSLVGGNSEIYVMNADGTDLTRLTDKEYDGSPCWSADGKRIAFDSKRDGNWEIYVMNDDGSDQRNLTNSTAQDHLPAWRR